MQKNQLSTTILLAKRLFKRLGLELAVHVNKALSAVVSVMAGSAAIGFFVTISSPEDVGRYLPVSPVIAIFALLVPVAWVLSDRHHHLGEAANTKLNNLNQHASLAKRVIQQPGA